ncbi:MAG: SMP-30/gluconolactonase/LRE family protein [Candidatus Andeanibacterium colombiense]|uniref:SMP-30/gluconolactonase/LRE family protein n=1 Tax=Candidatus Andeanibacterium colombiense TaxID=3121345 RepID=A0AAJ5X664_9SPHN|nr:MAG: SMP-30/gluconolactonase/LRE family protein [Sphingomonadaceae bacterium]
MKTGKLLMLAAATAALGVSAGGAQIAAPMSKIQPPARPAAQMRGDGDAPAATEFSITYADPALKDVIDPDAKLVELARDFGLNEGPVWFPGDNDGYVLFGGLLDNVIYKVTLDKKVSVFLDYAGYTGNNPANTGAQTRAGRSHVLLIGPSCTGRDPEDRLVWCADNDRMVMRLEKDGTRTVLSAGYDGKPFNSPNDISVRNDGAIFMADNAFGLRGADQSKDKLVPNAVYLIKDGKTTKLLDESEMDGGVPNGITLSRDAKFLYLSTGHRRIKRYPVNADGTLGAGTIFTEGPGIGDGMKTDIAGNIYSSGGGAPGIVRITAPSGKLLGTLNLPSYGGEPKRQICATNIAFGRPDGRSLFITACDALYEVRVKIPGAVPGADPS